MKASIPLVSVLFFLSPLAAQTFSLNSTPKQFISYSEDLPIPAPQTKAAASAREEKDWTVMVYMNGKNNLEEFALADVNEMETIGSSDRVNMVVELARSSEFDESDGNWTDVRRFYIKKDNDTSKITSPVLQKFPQADMGSTAHLKDFIQWAKNSFPAKHFMLVIWNHGSGWDKGPQNFDRGISFDDETGHHISTNQLAETLKEAGPVDIYASDACFMQSAEVVYALRSTTDIVIGSEEGIPPDGFSYDYLLGRLTQNPEATPEQVSEYTITGYREHYLQTGDRATLSAVKTEYMQELNDRLSGWANSVKASGENAVVQNAMANAQGFSKYSSKDLYQFVKQISDNSRSRDVISKGKGVLGILDKAVITSTATGPGMNDAKGLAVYVPYNGYEAPYNGLEWSKNGSWDDFAVWMAKIRTH